MAPAWFVYTAAGVVGFAFFLMELVWFRMLGPILGGTTFTFGLILAVALTGIGMGGAAYSLLFRDRRPTLLSFGLTCGLEAAAIAVPYALGDRIAVLALVLKDLGVYGFVGEVVGWLAVTSAVVLVAALVAGLQFPILIALLGSGSHNLGRQVGYAFACNTAGAIAGSMVGGFGALPVFTAPGTSRTGRRAAGLVGSRRRVDRLPTTATSRRADRAGRRDRCRAGLPVHDWSDRGLAAHTDRSRPSSPAQSHAKRFSPLAERYPPQRDLGSGRP